MKTITPDFCKKAVESHQAVDEEPKEILPEKYGSAGNRQDNDRDEDESSNSEESKSEWKDKEKSSEEKEEKSGWEDEDEEESPEEKEEKSGWEDEDEEEKSKDKDKKSQLDEDDYGSKSNHWDKVHQFSLDSINSGNFSPEVMGLLARSSLGLSNPLQAFESFALSLVLANSILSKDILTSLLLRSDWLISLARLEGILAKLPLEKLKSLLDPAMLALNLAMLEAAIKNLEASIPALGNIINIIKKGLKGAIIAAEVALLKEQLEKSLNQLKELAASQAAQEAAAKAGEIAGQAKDRLSSAASNFSNKRSDSGEDSSDEGYATDEEEKTGEEKTGEDTSDDDESEAEAEDDDSGSPPIESPLVGHDESNNAYEVSYMEVQEEISQPFIATATIIAEEIDCSTLLGKEFHIYYEPDTGSHKHKEFIIHGIVTAVTNLSTESDDAEKKVIVQLKPWLSLLEYKAQCQIFQNADIKQIIDDLCSKYSVSMPFDFQSSASCQKRTFCAQINETDFDFITRLLAEEGFFYYFKHTESSHTLVIGSDNNDFLKFEGDDFEYISVSDNESRSLSLWSPLYEVHTADVTLQGYCRETSDPFAGQPAQSTIDAGTISGANTSLWDSALPSQDEGKQLSLTMAEQRDSAHQKISTASHVPLIRAGMTFKLGAHSDKSQEGEYYIRNISHVFMYEKTEYQNTFICTSSSYPFKNRVIAKPRMYGVQTACVSGPDNEEVYTDGAGCVKVRFHWDLSDTKGDSCSAWVPVVQSIAGEKFGIHTLPRVGQEVLVGFIDNDPDQPVVIGCLYNSKNETPYSEEYIIGLLTRSIPNGQEGHEIRLNDKKDEEEIYVKSQKDLRLNANNDMSVVVTGELTTQVEKDQKIEVKQNHSLKSDEKIALSSGKECTIDSGTDLKVTCQNSASYESIASTSISGSDVTIEGKSGITLKCAGSEINISPTGITIKAPSVSVEAQTSLSLKGLTAEVESSTACSVKGQVAVMIKGGITQIN